MWGQHKATFNPLKEDTPVLHNDSNYIVLGVFCPFCRSL